MNDFLKDKEEVTTARSICPHKNVKRGKGHYHCQDCGKRISIKEYYKFKKTEEAPLEENLDFEKPVSDFYSDSQIDYERKIRVSDSKALQDPVIKEKYERLKTLEKWFRDYESDFSEQKKTIDLLKSHGIGLTIDNVKYREIRDLYLRYNKNHRHNYQNMVIIFLAIIWLEIKDTTNIRIDEFIKVSKDLGHKINKKMITNAMLKVKQTKKMLKEKKSISQLEEDIKEKIKVVFQKDLNSISYEDVNQFFENVSAFEKKKISMQLIANKILNQISYEQIQSLNYKAFVAGLIYYIGQTFDNRKIFTQSLIEKYTKFSSTTIRKKYHTLKEIIGEPQEFTI
ncbi:MAG: hypothetical protein ACW98D_12605 [Promethearchaeota archaeon]|jgi:hypothetical protein